MKRSQLSVVALILALLIVPSSLVTRAQQRESQTARSSESERDEREEAWRVRAETIQAARNNEEKLVRGAYVKLMRYHAAYVAEMAASRNAMAQPGEQIRLELRNVRTGMIDEILDSPADEMVTEGAGSLIRVERIVYSYKNGPEHLMYKVEPYYAEAQASPKEWEGLSVGEMITATGEPARDVAMYSAYEVRVQLGKHERTYKALALYGRRGDSAGRGSIEIIDKVVGRDAMRRVLADELPLVRAPWNKYIRSGTYMAIARTIKQAREQGRELIWQDAPPGYLPGDDVAPDARGGQLVSDAACQNPMITSISPETLNVSTGDDASARTLTVTFTPDGATVQVSFQPTFLNNLGGTTQASLTVPNRQGIGPLTTTVKAASAEASGVFAVHPALLGELSPKESRVVVPPQILLQMMRSEAGFLQSSTLRQLLGWSMRNRFNDRTYFQGQSTYSDAINTGATVDARLKKGEQPELDAAAGVFDGFIDPTSGCQGFWSPTSEQWQRVQAAIGSDTLPANVGAPAFINIYPRQYVYFSSVGINNRPGYENAPAFLFVRKREPNQPAVVQLD